MGKVLSALDIASPQVSPASIVLFACQMDHSLYAYQRRTYAALVGQ